MSTNWLVGAESNCKVQNSRETRCSKDTKLLKTFAHIFLRIYIYENQRRKFDFI